MLPRYMCFATIPGQGRGVVRVDGHLEFYAFGLEVFI